MSREEKEYYRQTGGLPPHQHERLDPLAGSLRDTSHQNATGREDFLQNHPFGYHNKRDQNNHYGWAEEAYEEYEDARDRQKHHERHRSHAAIDGSLDPWGRPRKYDR